MKTNETLASSALFLIFVHHIEPWIEHSDTTVNLNVRIGDAFFAGVQPQVQHSTHVHKVVHVVRRQKQRQKWRRTEELESVVAQLMRAHHHILTEFLQKAFDCLKLEALATAALHVVREAELVELSVGLVEVVTVLGALAIRSI